MEVTPDIDSDSISFMGKLKNTSKRKVLIIFGFAYKLGVGCKQIAQGNFSHLVGIGLTLAKSRLGLEFAFLLPGKKY